ncbi:Uu.00g021520.m01.CDS01 [Anthostomella pinea]|uniref:Uu.00g021520.m01.CDS01 n=1 Tax=Anthostomella pinea TaxID=933095 RepID=A0AAI8VZP9_9PEZI|nr:Uu.00g021520.m01.CDS01 [Anthostomella pinea]
MYLHTQLKARKVDYYFCGGFACINVGMTARTTSGIDIAVPNGSHGYGTLLDIFSRPPFIQDKTGVLPPDSYYFYVESSGNFVEVDGVIAGFMAFPEFDPSKVIQVGKQMQLNFLEPAGLLRLKLSSWANETRRNGPKRGGDMSDITSIRDLLASNGMAMDLVGLRSDMAKGLREWVHEFKDLKNWQRLDRHYKG